MPFYDQQDAAKLGFAEIGRDVLISTKASIYRPERISLGDRVRIDDFSFIIGGERGIEIGDNVHIGAFASLCGHGRITMEDFSGLAPHCAVYSSSDDYSGRSLTNPTVGLPYTALHTADIKFGRHVIVGSSSVVLPGVVLEEGCSVGAMSLVKDSFPPFTMIAGQPAKAIRQRRRDLLAMESEYRAAIASA
ncbi:MAG: dTDP-4-amino-4,6-dideoxy-D-glucose acetyltransferase VioB [Sphingomonadales bacterium]